MTENQAEPAATPESASSNGATTKEVRRSRPARELATDRIKCEKQFEIIRAYVSASGPEGKQPVTNQQVADIVQMTASTVSMGNAFWTGIGFLQKADGGYLPALEVLQYALAHEWNPETAAHKLAPLLQKTWFVEKLIPKLRHRDLREDEALADLADAAQAGPQYKNQLRMLIDYAVTAGLFARENGMIKLVRRDPTADSGTPALKPSAAEVQKTEERPPAQQPLAPVKSHTPDQGGIGMQFTIHVTAAELASWQPERIAAFFKGIADVFAAKGKSGEEVG